MKKLIVFLALGCFMVCGGSAQAFAAEPCFEVLPYMDYIAQANGSLYIDSKGVATVKSSIYGYPGTTTRVEISAKLQQYKSGRWISIKTFTSEDDSHRTSLSNTYTVDQGYTYRVKATIKAYSGSSIETRVVTSSEASY